MHMMVVILEIVIVSFTIHFRKFSKSDTQIYKLLFESLSDGTEFALNTNMHMHICKPK